MEPLIHRSSFNRLVLFVAALALPGCSNDQEAREERALVRFSAEPVALAEWWTNGHALLRLRPDGGYSKYPGLNPHEAPAERGRWSHRTNVALEFDPYAAVNARVERVQIDRDSEGQPVLVLPREWPFVPMDAPPEVLEDSLFGQWRSAEFTLTLSRSMRYALRHASPATDGAAALAGHEGSWFIRDGDEVVLVPDAPGIDPVVLQVEGGSAIAIAGAERVESIR